MRTLAIAFALLVAGCGHSQSSSKDPPAGTGERGAVCQCGNQRPAGDPTCVAVECKPGLSCGYGCGVDGCDSTCMTAEEVEQSSRIP
jgi:hypothetical protein